MFDLVPGDGFVLFEIFPGFGDPFVKDGGGMNASFFKKSFVFARRDQHHRFGDRYGVKDRSVFHHAISFADISDALKV